MIELDEQIEETVAYIAKQDDDKASTIQDWKETHFEVVAWIMGMVDYEDSLANREEAHKGRGRLYELAESLTDEFQGKYSSVNWGKELEYYATFEAFLNDKNK